MCRNFLLIHLFLGVLVIVPPTPVEISANNFTICTRISQEVNGKILWWGNYTNAEDDEEVDAEWYISEPLCLSENYTIVRRRCSNGTWDEEPSCSAIQRALSPCPETFTYNKEKAICYVIVSNQTFPPLCPYGNVISFYDYASLVGNEISGPVWFPATRLGDYGVGEMSLVEPTRFYGSVLSVTYSWRNSFNKNCLISYSADNYESVHCNSTYDGVCAYKPLGNLQNTYCKTIDNQCYYSDYDLNSSKCFCLQNNVEQCNALAEFKKPYQNFIIPSNRSKCRIALGLDGNFLWTNSREVISYSNWDRNTDFSNRYGVLTEESSWSLDDDNYTDCSICEETTTFDGVTMSFTIDTKNKQLVLTVDNPGELYTPEDSDDYLFCFTDTEDTTSSVQYSHIAYDSSEVINNTRLRYYFSYSSKFPGHYWCQAFMYPSLEVIKTDTLLVFDEDIYGNEFATTIVVEYNSSVDPRTVSFCREISDTIYEKLAGENQTTISFYIRFLTIIAINEDDFTIEYLIHVTSKRFCDVELEYDNLNALIASGVSQIGSILYMTDFRSVSYCLEDTTESNGAILRWPLTKINTTVTPEEFCLQEDGLPVTRTCAGDFSTGAKWSKVMGSCADNPVQSTLTAKLYELVHTNATLTSKSDLLVELTQGVEDYIPVDIHYIAEILDKSDKESVDSIENVTTVIDNIICTDKRAMTLSQTILNSTDRILYNYDLLLQKFIKRQMRKPSDSIMEIITRNLMVFVFDAKLTDVTGIAIFSNNSAGTGRDYVKLRRNVSYADFKHYENLEMAVFIPDVLLEQITENISKNQPLIVTITVFLNDYLFNEQPRRAYGNPYRSVLGILLPTIDEEYEASVSIFYNFSETSDKEEHCAYWHYGSSDFENIKGEWKRQNEPLMIDEARVCNFEHTTHFALLVVADISAEELETYAKHSTVLHVVTSIGCSLSIMGVFCIFFTAMIFTRWRQNKGNQIVMHYSAVTILQIALLYISEQVRNSGESVGFCVFIGVSLHYIVLAQFCWMLVMGVLHYQRFVLVFVKPNQRIMLKACIFGYALPTVPIIINLSTLSPSNYVLGNTGMCYPTGNGFIFCLLTPVLTIAALNLILFFVIIWNVFHEKIDDLYKHDYVLVLKLRLVAVLFSLLGITWVFGFAAEFFGNVVFAYFFTITGSLQGFIIFLAFVITNDSTRHMYYILITKSYKYRKW